MTTLEYVLSTNLSEQRGKVSAMNERKRERIKEREEEEILACYLIKAANNTIC